MRSHQQGRRGAQRGERRVARVARALLLLPALRAGTGEFGLEVVLERKAAELAQEEEDAALEAARKRMEAEEGLAEDGEKVVKLSKKEEKERLEAKRNKQGVRTAKTGPRRNKFDAKAKEEAERKAK